MQLPNYFAAPPVPPPILQQSQVSPTATVQKTDVKPALVPSAAATTEQRKPLI